MRDKVGLFAYCKDNNYWAFQTFNSAIILHEYIDIFKQLPKIPSFKAKIQFLFLAPASEKWKQPPSNMVKSKNLIPQVMESRNT